MKKSILATLVALALVAPAAAAAQSGTGSRIGTRGPQGSVTSADIQRLQDDVYQASSDLSRMRDSDANATMRLQDELDDLRDEVIYLKVLLRKRGAVSRAEYADVRDRIQDLRARLRSDRADDWRRAPRADDRREPSRADIDPPRRSEPTYASSSVIPVGQEIDVRLQSSLSSETAEVEDRFEATTVVDLYRGNDVLIPAGSLLRGVVRTVDRATRTDRQGELTVSFDQITVRGRVYPMRGTVTEALQSEGMKGEAGRIGAGSAIGGIIGGIIGGVKGALLGVLIGGGGTIAATPGKDVTLPPGTILRVRLDTPPDVR